MYELRHLTALDRMKLECAKNVGEYDEAVFLVAVARGHATHAVVLSSHVV